MSCAGEMGWSEREFNLSTPRYFFAAYDGHLKNVRKDYEIGRFIGYLSAAPHMKKVMPIDKFWPFSWEKKSREIPKATPEELEAMRDRARRIHEQIKKKKNGTRRP